MTVIRENLIELLRFAIAERAEVEKAIGYQIDSGVLASWRGYLSALERGESLIIVHE